MTTTTKTEPTVDVTCRNCGNHGPLRQFETAQGTLHCQDCNETQRFAVREIGGGVA